MPFETLTESQFVDIYENLANVVSHTITSVVMHRGEHPELGKIVIVNGTAGDYCMIRS